MTRLARMSHPTSTLNKGLFTSNSCDWETPQTLFDELNNEFQFTLDVCADSSNRKCGRFFDKYVDGLIQNWSGERCWMNPPYGRQIVAWVAKAETESWRGALVVGLLPARTDAKWFHRFVYGRAEIRFLPGRIRFSGAKRNAPFPSMIAIWR